MPDDKIQYLEISHEDGQRQIDYRKICTWSESLAGENELGMESK